MSQKNIPKMNPMRKTIPGPSILVSSEKI